LDFVVLGFGLGALAVLIGLGVRDLGPLLRRVRRDADLAWSEVARRVAWGRACRALGLLAALGGAAVCSLTLLALMFGASDGTGMTLVVLTLLVVALLLGTWFLLDRRRGATGGALGAVGRLGATFGALRRRPLGAGPPARPARRPARRAVAAPPGGRAAPREPSRPAARPAAASSAGAPRSDPWRRSAVSAGYLEPEDEVDTPPPARPRAELTDPPPRRVERGR
jgi:hypothetical protein